MCKEYFCLLVSRRQLASYKPLNFSKANINRLSCQFFDFAQRRTPIPVSKLKILRTILESNRLFFILNVMP